MRIKNRIMNVSEVIVDKELRPRENRRGVSFFIRHVRGRRAELRAIRIASRPKG
jgi:hypothetical protein